MEYKEEFRYLTNICLNLTDACNLACRYCFVEQHPHYMTYETAQAALDWIIQNLQWKKENGYCNKYAQAGLTFFGGEPMLCYDSIIVPLVTYAEEQYPNQIIFTITTNGTLLTEERIQFFKDHHIQPLLSIDGAKETQDYNRPCHNGESSFDAILPNIPALLEAFPDTTFRSTIDEDTVDQFFKNYVFAEYLGFRNYFATPNNRRIWKQENITILEEQLKLIFLYRLEQFRKNTMPMNFSIINDAFENVLKRDIEILNHRYEKPALERSVSRCGLGTASGSIAYDGSIYGCQEQPSKDDKNIFLIGNIFENGIDIERHKQLLDLYNHEHQTKSSNMENCEHCKLKSICTTFACPSTSWDLYKSLTTVAELHCKWLLMMFDYCCITMKLLVKEDNECFKTYLQYFCNFNQYFINEEINNGL